MYSNLNLAALGVNGRQSELIELALTYGFDGLTLDMAAIVKRARESGSEQACRFVASAGIRGGEFPIPFDPAAQETTYRSSLVELGEFAEVAESLKATSCRATIPPVCVDIPYQENFELYRSRMPEVADILASHGIRLGLAFQAAAAHREGAETPFIHTGEALMTLIRTISSPNVGLALDTWDWFVGGGSLDDLLAIPGSAIVSCQLADIPSTADLATIAEQDRCMPSEDGLIDCRAIVQHLVGTQFDGPISICPDPSQLAGMTRDAIVQQAKATLKDLTNPKVPAQISESEEAAAEADVTG